jgi:excisionase family DNA binding protein
LTWISWPSRQPWSPVQAWRPGVARARHLGGEPLKSRHPTPILEAVSTKSRRTQRANAHGRGMTDTMLLDRKTVSIPRACELVGVSRRTIYNWIAGGKIQYVRTAGGSVRIFADTLWRKADVQGEDAEGEWSHRADGA